MFVLMTEEERAELRCLRVMRREVNNLFLAKSQQERNEASARILELEVEMRKQNLGSQLAPK